MSTTATPTERLADPHPTHSSMATDADLPQVPRQVAVFLGTLAAVLLFNAVIYVPVSSAPFVFDSAVHIRNNAGLDQGQIGGTRWIPMASFAVDRWLYGGNVQGFHFTSICVHLAATCLVFWTAYVTLGLSRVSTKLSASKLEIAAFSALCWSVHPLQTQPVLYTVQRMETLMAPFSLAAMLLLALSFSTRRQSLFLVASAACYFVAVGCKDVAIALPLVLLVFDFVFSSNDASAETPISRVLHIAKRRAWFYVVLLALSYPLLQPLSQVAKQLPSSAAASNADPTQNRSDVIDVAGLSPMSYALTQTKVVAKYVALACLPIGQNFDHGLEVSRAPFDLYFYPSLIGLVCLLGLYAILRAYAVGFCIAAFLLVLAPTSSIVPVRDLMVEHRMYLPLAFLVTLIIGSCFALIPNRRATIAISLLASLLLTGVAVGRAQVYRSGVSLWSDSVAKNPDNPRALAELARSYYESSKLPKAIEIFESAIALSETRPRVPTLMTTREIRSELSEVQNNYAVLLTRNGNLSSAQEQLEKAIQNNPENAAAHNSLGNVFVRLGDKATAKLSYEAALKIDPNMSMAKRNLAIITDSKP